MLYAGQTQYRGELWPHNFNINLQFGTMRTDLYLLTSLGRTAADLWIGTFCHENGHLLCRFPDMYDYGERDGDTAASAGIGNYCLMGSGNHLDNGRSPSPVCAYLRDLAGWCDNEIDLSVAGRVRGQARRLQHGDEVPHAASPTNISSSRTARRWTSIAGGSSSGLAVYHCDILGSNELQQGTATQHYQCALLQADGERHLELNVNQGDGADLFGETAGVALSGDSRPNSREWDGRDSGLVISDISAPGATITFRVGASGCRAADRVRRGDAQSRHPGQSSRPASRARSTSRKSGTVAAIKVSINIQHPYIGDLRVTLTSPGGKLETLHAQLGGIGRQSRRDLRFGLAGRARRDARTADEGRLGPQRLRPRRTGYRQAQELEDRTQERVGRLVSAERRAGSCRGLAAGGRGAPAPACRSAHAPRRQEEAQGCLSVVRPEIRTAGADCRPGCAAAPPRPRSIAG